MLKQLFSHPERIPHMTDIPATGGFIPFSEAEMAAVLGGGEETRPYITMQLGLEDNSTQKPGEQ
ncbi:hypothetical protein [Chitinophaga sp. RAB17]|uniref:hypothetical protein n=1 Tax=Chitinophaga sp. RAB17 TaxID=3233049 RepID=UPI003F900FD5